MTTTETAPAADVFADGTMTIDGSTAFSGIGRTQLYALMTAGDLAFTKVGNRRLIAKRSLVALLARGTAASKEAGE